MVGDPRVVAFQKAVLDVLDPAVGDIRKVMGGALGARRNMMKEGEKVLASGLFNAPISRLLKSEEGKERLRKIASQIKSRKIEFTGLLGAMYVIEENEGFVKADRDSRLQTLNDFAWIAMVFQVGGALGRVSRLSGAAGFIEEKRADQALNAAVEKILGVPGLATTLELRA